VNPFATATEMLAALDAGRTTPCDLLEMHLGRIAKYNPEINAIVVPNTERARERAAAADAERAAGKAEGAFHGLPVTIKESYQVAGLQATAGIDDLAGNIPDEDGPIAEKVFGAGAVLIGKTNVPPFLADWQSSNAIYGRTVNPWDHSRTPGGSTGGGAAAVAAGLSPLEFGSDIGGSIRVPAAFCGIFGHKPSDTALPRSGGFPPESPPNPASIMSVQGPLARSATDLELAFDVVAGAEPGEDIGWRLDIRPARHESLADFRVAVMPAIDFVPVDPEIVAALESVVGTLYRLGAKVQEAKPNGFDAREHHALYVGILNAIMLQRMGAEERAMTVEALRRSDDEFAAATIRGVQATAADYFMMLRERDRFRRMYREFFRDWDILLAPITIVPAFHHDDAPFPERRLRIDGKVVYYNRQVVHPGLATLAGQPATAFPVTRSSDGLPIGLQAIGPYLEDRTPLRFAQLLEREIGGFVPPPRYA
jgi:amidase